MINIKIDKNNNNAIAAINRLYSDYCIDSQIKSFMILKIKYRIGFSKRIGEIGERKIFIDNIDSFFIEEIDFSNGHKQDNRGGSKIANPNSCRLQISPKFRKDNKIKIDSISYQNTVKMIKDIFER